MWESALKDSNIMECQVHGEYLVSIGADDTRCPACIDDHVFDSVMNIEHHTVSERAMKATLAGVFVAGLAGISLWRKPVKLGVLDYVMLVFAVLRAGRLIAFDKVSEPFRAPVAVTQKHPYSGMTTEAKYSSGWRRSLGELVTCPICAGMWAAAAMLVGLSVAQRPTRLIMSALSAIGAAELLNAIIEVSCWAAAVARRHAG